MKRELNMNVFDIAVHFIVKMFAHLENIKMEFSILKMNVYPPPPLSLVYYRCLGRSPHDLPCQVIYSRETNSLFT